MKRKYYRHIYTWTEGDGAGQRPGWGIRASSTPERRQVLAELEKMAAAADPDWQSQLPVESLMYSPVCGYVKMTASVIPTGNRGRRNKLVRLYQLEEYGGRPEEYLEPGDRWGREEEGSLLSELELEIPLRDRHVPPEGPDMAMSLKELARQVYETLAGDQPAVNLVFPDWEEGRFVSGAREVMFLIHELLPESLRRKAAYLSYSRSGSCKVPFSFSDQPLQGRHNIFPREEDEGKEENPLDEYFFSSLTEAFLNNDGAFDRFLRDADIFLRETGEKSDNLRKMEWIFLAGRGRSQEEPEASYIRRHMPQLLFWGASDPAFASFLPKIRDRVFGDGWTWPAMEDYIGLLAAGCMKRSLRQTAAEIYRVMQTLSLNEEDYIRIFRLIKKENQALWSYMTGSGTGEKEGPSRPKEKKKRDRQEKKPAAKKEKAEPERYLGEDKKEGSDRDLRKPDRAGEEPLMKKYSETALMPTTAQIRPVEGQEDSLPLMVTGLVQGFMTGCMLYLAHYTVRLGHWKIALGLFGIWLLILSNYCFILREREERSNLWLMGGFCLVEGLIIEIAAWLFPSQRIRLYFFIILGTITFIIQTAAVVRAFLLERH